MKTRLTFTIIVTALTLSTRAADISTKITGIHICCGGCVRGVEKSVADVKGVKVAVDEDAQTVTLTGSDKASVQKAADALVAGGYFGKSSDDSIKMAADSGAKGEKVPSLKLEGVHLCCGQCVSAVEKAVKTVAGVKEHTAKKNAESFEVTGEFNDKDLIEAIQKAGFSARVAKGSAQRSLP